MDCGIASAEYLENEAPLLEKWLNEGNQGKMSYLENYFDLRLDVRKLVPGAKSVIVFLCNYYPAEELNTDDNYKIARYAYGEDYHFTIKKKLKKLLNDFSDSFGEVNGRCFVDSAPVMERVWAQKAGLGWQGKNSLLLNQKQGSFFFLAEIILDVELEYDSNVSDHCGSCTACIDACPTEALTPYWMDSNKCISYLTIELRDSIDPSFEGKFEDWVFGCDICQEVCPWNKFSKPHHEESFTPSKSLKDLTKQSWDEITEDVFQDIFRQSALKRTGFKGIKRNVEFVNRVP